MKKKLFFIVWFISPVTIYSCKSSDEQKLIGSWEIKKIIYGLNAIELDHKSQYRNYEFLSNNEFIVHWASYDVGNSEKGTWHLEEIKEGGTTGKFLRLTINNGYETYSFSLRLLSVTDQELITIEELKRGDGRNGIKVCYYEKR